MPAQNPVIVIPGITASNLVDDYPLKADRIWSMVMNREYERVALHPDDMRYEAIEPARVVAGAVFPVYRDLIRAMRHELSPRMDQPTPVFAFPHDWRMDISLTAAKLGSFIEEVIARARLLRHYSDADEIKVDLVGHSMGGLVISEYLAEAGRSAGVGKVATIGTPFCGSVEAIVKVATGMSLLTGTEPREREREAARITPAVYQLFPSYAGAAIDDAGRDVDVFDYRNMQASIVASITEFVRLYSVHTKYDQRRSRAVEILKEMLAKAKAHRQKIQQMKLADSGLRGNDWLSIAGADEQTRLQLTVRDSPRGPWFVIDEDQVLNDVQAHRTGDGTVALPSAIPPFLPGTRLVCVTGDDVGRLELRDRLLVQVGGLHALLPRINLVQRLVIRHLKADFRGRVWGRRLPGSRSWNPPIRGLQEKRW